MKQTILKITIIIGMFLIGFISGISYQYNYDHNYNKKIITKMQSEYNHLKDKYASLTKIIKPLKQIAGLTDMKGEGVIISIDKFIANSGTKKEIQLNEKDLSQLIKKLWINGAQAMAINGARINISTKLTTKKNQLFINQTPISTPVTINVLGDKISLYNIITTRNGLMETLKIKKIKTKVSKGSTIIIPPDKSYFFEKDINKLDQN